ncbi:Uncharacterized protein Fot_06415 [Forsythia ovata]|uniref:Uncharacterized protein n=1 Tax=Forsythia ovata TaxID=205694 RepID=A0ABD1WSW2_9LAMI
MASAKSIELSLEANQNYETSPMCTPSVNSSAIEAKSFKKVRSSKVGQIALASQLGQFPHSEIRIRNHSSLTDSQSPAKSDFQISAPGDLRPRPASRARLQPPDTAAAPLQQSASQRCCSLVQDFRFSHLPTAIIILHPKSAAADECRCLSFCRLPTSAAADQIKEFRVLHSPTSPFTNNLENF